MIIMISDVINLRNACDFLFVSVSLFTAVTYLREIFVLLKSTPFLKKKLSFFK